MSLLPNLGAGDFRMLFKHLKAVISSFGLPQNPKWGGAHGKSPVY